MRLDFVKIFVDSTAELFRELIGSAVDVPWISMKPTPVAGREVMAIIGLAGQAHGRVIFDMDLFTAVQLAGHMLGEPSPGVTPLVRSSIAGHMLGEPSAGITPLVRSSIAELACMAIGRAISKINDGGTILSMSPPTVITGANLVSYDRSFETLVAPIVTAYGEVGVNVTIQDLN